MKNALPLLLAFTFIPLAWADGGGFARAEEFGSPRLDMTQVPNPLMSKERVWNVAGAKPFRALLLGIDGKWGKDAKLILRTPTGRELRVPAASASDDDLQSVRDWMKDNEFVKLEPIGQPETYAKIISVIRPEDRRRAGFRANAYNADIVFMIMPDGTRAEWRVNQEHVDDTYAKTTNFNNITWVNDNTRVLLETIRLKQQEDIRSPLPIAENADEAIAWSAATGNSIVMLNLNRRGSLTDIAFRQYLAKRPHAAGQWGKRHVFLLAYMDDQGRYPAECIQAIVRIKSQHPFFSRASLQPEDEACLTSDPSLYPPYYIHACIFRHPDSFPEYGFQPQTYSTLRLRINEFLTLPPDNIAFGLH